MSIGEGIPDVSPEKKYKPWELDLGVSDLDTYGPQFSGRALYLEHAADVVVSPEIPVDNPADAADIVAPYAELVPNSQDFYERQATELNRGEAIVQPGRGIN